jgi:hypothetical protein
MDNLKKLFSSKSSMRGFYLVILEHCQIDELQGIFQLFWNLQIYNVNIMFQGENNVTLVKTFMPFNAQNCGDTSPITVNEFKHGKFSNDFDQFYLQKMKNLHNCSILISTSYNDEPFIFSERYPNGTYRLYGSDITLINTLSEILNFRINITFIGDYGYCYENGTCKGPLKAVMDGVAELSISNWWLKKHRLQFFDVSIPYNNEQVIFVIPPGREFTSFEKLVYPFTLHVWILILMCFIIGYIVIFIFKRLSSSIQTFIFGPDLQNPYLNMFIGFIGGSQHVVPKTNFARFLLMMFLMYSLIVRTLYQGSFYELMQSNKHHNELQSIDEMIAKDFKFYVPHWIADLFQATDAMARR